MRKLTLTFAILSLLILGCIYGRQFIFKEQIFTSDKTCEFILNKDFKSIKRNLILNDITSQIIKYQGGEILNSKLTGFDVRTPLKDLKAKQIKEFIVSTKNGIFSLRQTTEIQSNQIKSQTILSQPDDLVKLYENTMTLTETENRTKVVISVKIEIKEHAPFHRHIQSQLDEAAQSNLDACKYILENL